MTEYLPFIERLGRKLHRYVPVVSAFSNTGNASQFLETRMTTQEFDELSQILLEHDELALNPSVVEMGAAVIFDVLYTSESSDRNIAETIMRFHKQQLPSEYTFDHVARVYTDERNLKRFDRLGLKRPDNRRPYHV